VRFHRWRLGFKQCSFRLIARALQDETLSVFKPLPLLRHALFPSGFRLQVNRMAQRYPSEPLLTASRIQYRVPRRTVSPHTAQALISPFWEPAFLPWQYNFCRLNTSFEISVRLTSGITTYAFSWFSELSIMLSSRHSRPGARQHIQPIIGWP
jgi:hypothetical protein